MMKKTNEKKVLHKVKKRWIVLGTALFALAGAGAYPETANADISVNHSLEQSSTTSSADDKSSAGNTVTTSSTSASGSTTSISNADTSNASTTTQSSGSQSSTSVESGSSSATSLASNSSATSTVQDDVVLYRDGDTTSTASNRPNGTSATNLSLVDSKPSKETLSYPTTGSNSGNQYSVGVDLSTNSSGTYHAAVVSISYSVQFANQGSESPITGISNLVQHVQLSGGSEVSAAADVNSYSTFIPNFSSASNTPIDVSEADSSVASTASELQFSSGPLDTSYDNKYYAGDKVWWTFDVIKNDSFSSTVSILNKSVPTIATPTPVQIQLLDNNNNPISSAKWVTGDNIYPGNTFSLNIPNVNGYQFNGGYSILGDEKVANEQNSAVVTGSFESVDQVLVKLNYNAATEPNVSGTVTYFDANDKDHKIALGNDTYNGPIGTTINYSTQSAVDSLTSQGYSLASGVPSASIILNSSNNNYEFDFTHKTSVSNEEKTFNRNINFVDASNGQSIQSPASQTVTYSRSDKYDEVTKKTSYGNWTATNNGSFSEYFAPSISGYDDPQPASIAASSVDINTQPSSINNDIKYTKSVAASFSGNVKYIDTDDQNNEIASNETFGGNSGTPVNYSTQSVVDSLTSKGYSLTSDSPVPSDSIIINSSNNDYTFKFTHKTSATNESKTFTRNINFVDSATNSEIPSQSSVSQTVTYSRSGTYDEVTKQTSYGNWAATNKGSFSEYAAPSIAGYDNPNPTSVPASSVNSDDSNTTTSATIAYTKTSSSATPSSSSATPTPSSSIASSSQAPVSASSSYIFVSSSASSTSTASSSSAPIIVASVATKMYNNETQLIKSGNQILIYVEPRYANNTGIASTNDSYVVNIQNTDGTVSHKQLVTLDQYNAMLIASGKAPYTPEDLQQAYNDSKNNQGILDNDVHKTTFDARTVQKGNDTFIFTGNGKKANGDFKRPKDGKLVSTKGKKNHPHKGNKHSFKNKKKQIKNKRNHMKMNHHHAKKNHSHHKK